MTLAIKICAAALLIAVAYGISVGTHAFFEALPQRLADYVGGILGGMAIGFLLGQRHGIER